MKKLNDQIIIGVDHGYGNIKTANHCFRTGILGYDSEPLFTGDMLTYGGRYYLIGEGHKEFIAEKIRDEDYYLLTLVAIAKELKDAELTEANIVLAAGLPLTWTSGQKKEFAAYLSKNKDVTFNYKKVNYHITIDDVRIYPQGYAAFAEFASTMKGVNLIADIGNGTMNVLYIKAKSEQRLRDLISQAEAESAPNPQLQLLFVKLKKQLDQHKGKKVYGYLPKDIKATVNEIVALPSREPAIEELYKEWNKINREKLSLYYENKDPTVPLADNKEFRSIKNMIIKAVWEMPTVFVPTLSAEEYEKQRKTIEPVSPQIHEEPAESEPPKTADSPPLVNSQEEHIPINTIATAQEIIRTLARLIGDKCIAHRQHLQEQIDHRLQQEINEKKQAMGLKTEVTQKPNYQTEETYEMSM